MELVFSCIADEELQLSDVCIDMNIKFDKAFKRKNYGDSINKVFICFISTKHEPLAKRRKRFLKKEKILELYPKVDRISIESYGYLDLRMLLGKHSVDQLRMALKSSSFKDFQADIFIEDFKNYYNKKILLDKFFLLG